ncbi:MAG: nucleoside triphosphate pyrophosphohydrolase, partial [Deltaproteobacteria bacterium]
KLREEQAELEAAVAAGDRTAAAQELGDVLLTLTSIARHLDVPAEMALRDATDRFVGRARRAANVAATRGTALADLAEDERERLWALAKDGD